MNLKTFLLCALILICTCGCSGTHNAYYQTIKIALAPSSNAEMTLSEIQQSEVDLISIKYGNRATAIMALAYLENNQHKWVSSDNVMIIMEKARIIRTLGLNKNLLYLSNTEQDPLKSLQTLLGNKSKQQTWTSEVDLSGDEYAYPIKSSFSLASQKILNVFSLNFETTLYTETVDYLAPSNYLHLNKSWKNYYWYNQKGELLKTVQKISALSDPLEITYLSRIARLNQ